MNEELTKIYEADQAIRKNPDGSLKASFSIEEGKQIVEQDKIHRQQVRELIDQGVLQEPMDYHHAAMVFQHGASSDDFKLAHELAAKAVEMGSTQSKWLFAATLDRYLLSTDQPQKYGTQFRMADSGEWELGPYDPATTDEERAEYFVPPIAEAIARYNKKYGH